MLSKIIIVVASLLIFSGTTFADPIDLSVDNRGDRSEVTMYNTTDSTLLVTLTVYDCNNLIGSSCGMVYGRIPMRPGQSLSKTIFPSNSSMPFSFQTRVNWVPAN